MAKRLSPQTAPSAWDAQLARRAPQGLQLGLRVLALVVGRYPSVNGNLHPPTLAPISVPIFLDPQAELVRTAAPARDVAGTRGAPRRSARAGPAGATRGFAGEACQRADPDAGRSTATYALVAPLAGRYGLISRVCSGLRNAPQQQDFQGGSVSKFTSTHASKPTAFRKCTRRAWPHVAHA